ncbi:MAG: DUF1549 domain-containing protein [Gemmataceae bacterium]
MATCLWVCLSRMQELCREGVDFRRAALRASPLLWSLCVLILATGFASGQDDLEVKDSPTTMKAKKLAERLDQLIEARWKRYEVQPAPLASNETYFRRLSLDLQGRIPTLIETDDFLDDDRENKRSIWIEQMLASRRNSEHLANSWGSVLLPDKVESTTLGTRAAFQQTLRMYFEKNTSYQVLARNIITNQNRFNRQGLGSFYQLHGNTPESMATATSRVFLGVKLDCAQCHAHPFAEWTQDQFWEMAAFFNASRLVRNTKSGRTPAIQIPKTKKVVVAKFLNGAEPDFRSVSSGRQVLADWVVSNKNPYFARATVDHLWMTYFGVSLFEPILQDDADAITHPKLLDTLAKAFIDSDYDIKFMVRAIVHTKAYQRSTQNQSEGPIQLALFARMPVRMLTAEQMYDSIITATSPGYIRSDVQTMVAPFNPYQPIQSPRFRFLLKFPEQKDFAKNQTSILQALHMMNGQWLANRVDGKTNKAILDLVRSNVSLERKIQSFYMMILSRLPNEDEARRYLRYVANAKTKEDQAVRFSNIAWAMLNSAEFRVNH